MYMNLIKAQGASGNGDRRKPHGVDSMRGVNAVLRKRAAVTLTNTDEAGKTVDGRRKQR